MFHSNIVESAPQCAEDATAATTNVPIAQEGELPSDDIGMQDRDSQSVAVATETNFVNNNWLNIHRNQCWFHEEGS